MLPGDNASGEVSANNPSVALWAPAPFTQGSLRLTAPKAPAAEAAPRPSGQQALPIEAGSRPGTFVPRPPGKGPGRGHPFLVSGASRKESGSFFPATCAAGKILLAERSVGAALAGPAPKRSAIATGGTPGLARGNGSAISTKRLTERSVAARPPLGGLWSAPEHSALPSSQRPKGAETGPPRPNVPRYIWAKLVFSQRKASLRRAVRPSTA